MRSITTAKRTVVSGIQRRLVQMLVLGGLLALPPAVQAQPTLESLVYQYQTDAAPAKVSNNLTRQINVLDYREAGKSGPEDNGAALVMAINGVYGGTPTLYLPAGIYQVADPIDATRKLAGLRLVGDGQDRTIITGGKTGEPLLDLSASKYVQLSDLTIHSEVASCIVLFARGCDENVSDPLSDDYDANEVPASGNARLTRVKISGDPSVAGICNIGSEVNYFDRVVIHMTGSGKEVGYFNDMIHPADISSSFVTNCESSNVASVWIQPLIQIDSAHAESRAMEIRNHQDCTMLQPHIITNGARGQIVGQSWKGFHFLGGVFEAKNPQAVTFRLFESDMKGKKYKANEKDSQGINDLRFFSLVGLDFLGVEAISCESSEHSCSEQLNPIAVQGFRASNLFMENNRLAPMKSTLIDVAHSRSAYIRSSGSRVNVTKSSRADRIFEIDVQSDLANSATDTLGSVSRIIDKPSTLIADLAQREQKAGARGGATTVSDRASLVWANAKAGETALVSLRSEGRRDIQKTIRLAAANMHSESQTGVIVSGKVEITDIDGVLIDGEPSCTLTHQGPHVTLGLVRNTENTASWVVLAGECK